MRLVLVIALLAPAPAVGELRARVRLEAGFAENPFFDRLDPERGTYDAAARFAVVPDLRLDLHPDVRDRLRLEAAVAWERYEGDVDGHAWQGRLATAWRRTLSDTVAVETTAAGTHFRNDRFPDDTLWLGTGGMTLRWTPGRVSLAATGEAGGRYLPERVGLASAQPERGLLVRGRLEGDAGPFRPRDGHELWIGAGAEALRLRSNHAEAEGMVYAGDAWIDHDLGGPGWAAWGQVWSRTFDDARRDLGAGAGARLRWAASDTLEVGASWSLLASWSDGEGGRWRQQLATLDVTGSWSTRADPRPPRVEAPNVTPVRGGWRFALRDATARRVDLVGSFNAWAVGQTPLQGPDADGVWSVVVPLPRGRHAFQFVVDGGRWVVPEGAPGYEDDGFGQRNAVVYVAEAGNDPP